VIRQRNWQYHATPRGDSEHLGKGTQPTPFWVHTRTAGHARRIREAVCDAIACMSCVLAPRKYKSTNAYLYTQPGTPQGQVGKKRGCSAARVPQRTWDCVLCSRAATSRPPWRRDPAPPHHPVEVGLAACGAARWQWRAPQRGSAWSHARITSSLGLPSTGRRVASSKASFCDDCDLHDRHGVLADGTSPHSARPAAIVLSGL